jgi:hypothetical protein
MHSSLAQSTMMNQNQHHEEPSQESSLAYDGQGAEQQWMALENEEAANDFAFGQAFELAAKQRVDASTKLSNGLSEILSVTADAVRQQKETATNDVSLLSHASFAPKCPININAGWLYR